MNWPLTVKHYVHTIAKNFMQKYVQQFLKNNLVFVGSILSIN